MKCEAQAQPKAKGGGAKPNCAKPPADDAKPVRGRDGLLPAQRRFCVEYVLDWNGTQAAIRAGYSPKTAGSQAHDLLKKPDIRVEIGRLERKAAEKLEIHHTDLLKRLWDTATGDVNDLVRIERRACRYCYGAGHEYQWTTPREYRDAVDRFLLDTAKGNASVLAEMTDRIDAGRRIPGMPRDAGGYGFNATAMPSPNCPECAGEGIATVHVTDTRDAVSHPLYEGVKQTRDGIEVKIADRAKAMEQVARHMSFFKDEVKMNASQELLEAARKINAASPPLDARYMAKNASRLLGDEAEK